MKNYQSLRKKHECTLKEKKTDTLFEFKIFEFKYS